MEIDKEKALRRAAEIVAERGWDVATVNLTGADGPCCILKACANAAMEQGYQFEEWGDPYRELQALSFYDSLKQAGAWEINETAEYGGDPYMWNDHLPSNDATENKASQKLVIQKLLEAADLEASKVAST